MRRFLSAGAALALVSTVLVMGGTPAAADATADAVASAIVGDGITITGASYVTQADASTVDVRDDAIAGFPTTEGGSYAVMSTGVAADLTLPNDSGDHTTEFGASFNGAFDVTTLKIDFTVADDVNCLLGMRFRFLTEEFEEFVGSQFNDHFLVELDGNDWSVSGDDVVAPHNIAFVNGSEAISVNNSGLLSVSAEEATGTTFDGATEVLTAGSPLTPGAHSLYLTVLDMSDRRWDTSVLIDDLSAGTVDPALCLAGAIATNVAPPNRFVPLNPARILDTRPGGQHVGPINGPLPASTPVTFKVAGEGGVPDVGASAVVLNVTATDPAAAGFVRVSPADETTNSSNLNIEFADQDIANLVTVPLSDSGEVTLFSQSSTHLIADVFGYYVQATRSTEGRFIPTDPARVLNTRNGTGTGSPGPVPGKSSIDVQMTGRGGIPSSGVSAVVLNVTVTETATAGFLTAYPTGVERPPTSNVNYNRPGQTIPNQVIVPVGTGGMVSFYSLRGTHIIADVAGYYTDDTADELSTGLFVPVTPGRLLDTRNGTGDVAPIRPPAKSTVQIDVAGKGGVPEFGASSVVGNTTATQATAAGFVTVFPSGIPRPDASTLNLEYPLQTIPNHTMVKLGDDGGIALYTQNGTHLIFDVSGFFTS